MADTEIHLGTIGQIAIPVKNIETSLAFYRDKLGLSSSFRSETSCSSIVAASA